MKIVVLTSDKTSWALPAFVRQWEKYCVSAKKGRISENKWAFSFTISGYTQPDFDIPPYVRFESIGKFEDYPVERWSDGVIKYLSGIQDDLVMILMDDYWLTREVDLEALDVAEKYIQTKPDVIRFDLATDRMNDKHKDIGSIGRFDLIEAKKDATYNLSFQASIWRRELLLQVLKPGETPWETEINGSYRLNHTPYRVVGTRQWPLKYIIAVNKGKLALDGGWCVPPRQLSVQDREELIKNFIPEDKLS